MNIICLECLNVHQINGSVEIDSSTSLNEIHITCYCGNKLTVEKVGTQLSFILGCKIVDISLTPQIIHSQQDVIDHYYNGLNIVHWGDASIDEDAY